MAQTANRHLFQGLTVLACVVVIAVLGLRIHQATGGSFFFTLDDPYIHLSLAENLAHGHFGINAGETASPSSSILYPALVALTLLLGMGEMGPLLLNLIGACGVAWLLGGLVFDGLAGPEKRLNPVMVLVPVPLLAAVNGYALAWTGMEHTLHAFASLGILRGVIRTHAYQKPDIWTIIALLAAPLLRFEGLALTGAALLVIALRGQWRPAVALFATLIAALAGYVATMIALGLPPLPSSVLVKSSVTAAAVDRSMSGAVLDQIQSIGEALDRPAARWVLGGILALALSLFQGADRQRLAVVSAVGLAGFAHLALGQWGWYGRYEVYIVATLWAANLWAWAPSFSDPPARAFKALVVMVIAIAGARTYLAPLLTTPQAAANVAHQQYQMHRFATEFFPETVAVNDLGWVSYRNDAYVLDLWGLGSEKTRLARAKFGLDADWVGAMTDEANAVYAMVYPGLFKDSLPSDWCLMGVIRSDRVMSAFEHVGFYLIDSTREADMRAALVAYSATLPEGTTFTSTECATAYDWQDWSD